MNAQSAYWHLDVLRLEPFNPPTSQQTLDQLRSIPHLMNNFAIEQNKQALKRYLIKSYRTGRAASE